MPRLDLFRKLLGITRSEATTEVQVSSTSSAPTEFTGDTLTGSTALDTYAKMMRDAQVAGAYQQVVGSVVGGMVRIECEESEEIAEWANAVMERIEGSSLDMVEAALMMLPFGFSVQEVVWREYEGRWEPYQIIERASQKFTWEWDSKANEYVLQSNEGFGGKKAPLGKYLICRNGNNSGNPYGSSILKSCYKNWYSKLEIIKLLNVFLEKNASPNLIAKPTYPQPASVDDKVLTMLETFRQSSVAVVPSTYEIETINLGNPNAESQFRGALNYHDSQIARAILSESLTLEEGGIGARSSGQSATHATVLRAKGSMLRRKIAAAINEQLIKPMVALNFGEDAPVTRFIIEEPPVDALAEYTQAIKALRETGYLAGSEPWVLERAGLGETDMTDEMREEARQALLAPPQQGYTNDEVKDGGSSDERAS